MFHSYYNINKGTYIDMKILLISDTHGELNETRKLLKQHSDMDYYIHLGDVGFSLQELSHFHIVCGNHDRNMPLPKEQVLAIEDRRVLCLHGNIFDEETLQEVLAMTSVDNDDIMDICMNTLYHKLAKYAKRKGCNTLFFGHTHHQCMVEMDGVTLINPGSVCFGTPHSGYAIVEVKGKEIDAVFYTTRGIGEY